LGLNQVHLQRMCGDKPWQWAVLFVIFSFLAIPFYCFTRRTWRPFIYIFAGVGCVSLVWGIAVKLIEAFTGNNFHGNSVSESLLYSGSLVAIYGCGYFSVNSLRRNALAISRGDAFPFARNAAQATSYETELSASHQVFVPPRKPHIRPNHVFVIFAIMAFLLTAGYAIYSTAVESTIKSNPVLSAVAKTGTLTKIKHFNCGDMYGFYDSSIDTLQICAAVHDDQLFSSKEATIRHEAWHLVQACSAVKTKDDEWGEFQLVDSPLLAEKSLTPEESKYISDVYEVQDHAIEKEAFLAETHLTDGQIIQAIEEKCYFPD